jgi:hypothetical protein
MTSQAAASDVAPSDDKIGQLIESGASLSQIAWKCNGIEDAMREYGMRLPAMFPPRQDVRVCAQCESTDHVGLFECSWLGVRMSPWMVPIMSILMIFGWHLHLTYHVRFRTYHVLCAKCHRKLRWRRILSLSMYWLAMPLFTIAVITGALLAFDQDTLFALVGEYQKGDTTPVFFIGFGALALGILLLVFQDRLPLPSKLAFVQRCPFRLSSARVCK